MITNMIAREYNPLVRVAPSQLVFKANGRVDCISADVLVKLLMKRYPSSDENIEDVQLTHGTKLKSVQIACCVEITHQTHILDS